MTREWTTTMVIAFQGDRPDARTRLIEGVVSVVAQTRTHAMMRKIIELDPEFLTPYLLERRGSSTNAQLQYVEALLRDGHTDGSVRAGDPVWQARQVILVAIASAVIGPVMGGPKDYRRLDDELRAMLEGYLRP
jgi:hypothetical protein